MIAVDVCQANYETLLIIYQEFMIKYAKTARQEKKSGRNVNSLDIKIIDCITDAKNAINYALSEVTATGLEPRTT